jgi:large repetitive protein
MRQPVVMPSAMVVRHVAHALVAVPSEFTVAEGGVHNGVVTGTDAENDSLTFQLTIGPSYGTLTFNANGSFSYSAHRQPTAGFVDTDSFTFKTYDGEFLSEPATVSITLTPVNDGPNAFTDSFTVTAGDSYNSTVTGSDVDGDSLTFELFSDPSRGSVHTINPEGSFIYTADSDYSGEDSFTFRAYDGLEYSDPATINITIVGASDESLLIDEVPSVV